MIKKVNFRPSHTEIMEAFEEFMARFWFAQALGMFPEPKTYMLFVGVSDQVFDFGIGPARPIAFDDMMLETQLCGHMSEGFRCFKRVRPTAIEILPDAPAGLNPISVQALRE